MILKESGPCEGLDPLQLAPHEVSTVSQFWWLIFSRIWLWTLYFGLLVNKHNLKDVHVLIPVLRIRDVYPGSRILIFTHPGSRISDPGSKNSKKRDGWQKSVVIPFYVATNFTKLKIIFSFEVLNKKLWAKFQRIIELFTPNIVTKLSKIWVWDPGSEIGDPEKTYSGSRGQKGTGSRIRIRTA
jgi:hypothetical protein